MTMITCTINDKASLLASCMPFIIRGGLFLKGNFHYPIGTAVEIHLQLLTLVEPLVFMAKVVWLTPKYERDQWPEGMGVQFSEEDAKRVRASIEAIDANAFALTNGDFFNPLMSTPCAGPK